jgi:putative ubiquitin-RnfH superfamily antitoxin RatB of RatAB toxin-antitoxin module
MESQLIRVEVAYAEPARAVIRCYALPQPATVADALALAQTDPAFAGIDIATAQVGVFGTRVARDGLLGDGDRVEVYRPLAADPKIARRARARQQARRT